MPQHPRPDRGEAFIRDWHWDTASHEFARQTGSFLFQFIAVLGTAGLADRTLRKHISNCQLIGYFTCQYGRHRTFSPSIFTHGPSHLVEFSHEVSDSSYMLASYRTTWRKLARYARSPGKAEEQ